MCDFIEHPPVTRQLVPEDQRIAVTASLFGPHFPLQIEPVIYDIAEQMCENYQGGHWNYYRLSNSGFVILPDESEPFSVSGYYTGILTPEEFGVVCSTLAFNALIWENDWAFSRMCAKFHSQLLHYVTGLPKSSRARVQRAIF